MRQNRLESRWNLQGKEGETEWQTISEETERKSTVKSQSLRTFHQITMTNNTFAPLLSRNAKQLLLLIARLSHFWTPKLRRKHENNCNRTKNDPANWSFREEMIIFKLAHTANEHVRQRTGSEFVFPRHCIIVASWSVLAPRCFIVFARVDIELTSFSLNGRGAEAQLSSRSSLNCSRGRIMFVKRLRV